MSLVLFAFSTVSAFAVITATDGTYTAAASDGSLTIGATGAAVVKLSKNVKLSYKKQTTGLGYSVATYHTSGTKSYASSSGDSKIWAKDGEVVQPAAPSGTASADFTGWTPL